MVCNSNSYKGNVTPRNVLILILLEYGLQREYAAFLVVLNVVLILILLEYGLQQSGGQTFIPLDQSLNPYSTGIWSATTPSILMVLIAKVLILILLEYGLQPLKSQTIDLQTLKT